jgi:sensor histidine kinase YesM
MLNPIITQPKNFLVYLVSWCVIMLLHFVIMYFYFDFGILIAAADAGIYTVLLFLLGIGVWYIVRYLNISDQSYHLILADHLVTGGIIVLMWLFGGYYLLKTLFSSNTAFTDFLTTTLPWRFVFGILLYALIVLIYYLINYYKNYQEKLMNESELKQAVQESELNLLKAQINPHFLFNSLNSINSLIFADPEKAQEMVLELSDFLRYTVRKDDNEEVSLRDELDNIRKYLDIEKIRFGQRLVIDDFVEDACLDAKIPNLILQPIYENAIKHGVNESTETITITTDCAFENSELIVMISNNYSTGTLSSTGKGFGLENIRKRLLLHYKRTDLLEIEKSSYHFKVTLKIPQESINKNLSK